MFPYRVKYNESESDIQNNNLLYTIDKQCQNTFDMLENAVKAKIPKDNTLLFEYLYKLYNSYFVKFVECVILGFLYF